jgi:multicomponent Na+:H+ antiporter subunit C
MIYAFAAVLFTLGIGGMALLPNLLRKLLAMNVMQVAVIVFFISLAYKHGGSVPILGADGSPAAADFMNPLPHTLMLTAIVVSVATTGLALGLLIRIRSRFRTLNEQRLLDRLR